LPYFKPVYLAVIFLLIQSHMPSHHHFTKPQVVTLCIDVLNGLHWTVAYIQVMLLTCLIVCIFMGIKKTMSTNIIHTV